MREFRAACGEAHVKAILATGELGTLRNVAKASLVCMMAGADFIKTSTGKESVNATLPVSLVMVRAIREFYERTGFKVGFKPAGGIRTADEALRYLVLVKETLGDAWLSPHLFLFGGLGLASRYHLFENRRGVFVPEIGGLVGSATRVGQLYQTLFVQSGFHCLAAAIGEKSAPLSRYRAASAAANAQDVKLYSLFRQILDLLFDLEIREIPV